MSRITSDKISLADSIVVDFFSNDSQQEQVEPEVDTVNTEEMTRLNLLQLEAQDKSQKIIDEASMQAQEILDKARLEADQMILKAQEDSQKLKNEANELLEKSKVEADSLLESTKNEVEQLKENASLEDLFLEITEDNKN